MASFNDGLYTPFVQVTAEVIAITLPIVQQPVATTTPAAEVVPAVVATPTPIIDSPTPTPTPETSTPTPQLITYMPPTTTTSPLAAPALTPIVEPTLDSSTSTEASTPTSLNILPQGGSNSVANPFANLQGTTTITTTVPSTSPTSTISANSSQSSTTTFKISYLTPIFIIIPGLLLFTLLGWSYGKYWGKKRYQQSGGKGRWFPTYGSGGGKNSFDADRAILSPEEEGGLVEGRWLGEYDEKDGGGRRGSGEKGFYQQEQRPEGGRGGGGGDHSTSRWSSLVPASVLRIFQPKISDPYNPNSDMQSVPGSSFISVPYSSLDTPFNPPRTGNHHGHQETHLQQYYNNHNEKSYLTHSADEHERRQVEERGWNWGTKPPSTHQQQQGGHGGRKDSNTRKSKTLGDGWKWASKKYRAKREASISSFGGSERSSLRGAGAAPYFSPSLYSENGDYDHGRGGGAYGGNGNGGAGERGSGEAVLDMILAESRVGHGDFAQEYLVSSNSQRTTFPVEGSLPQYHRQDAQRFKDGPITTISNFAADYSSPRKAPPTIPMDLPATPSQLRTSPQKLKHSYLPGGAPSQLLFSYDSPPVQAFTSSSAQRDRNALHRISGPPSHPSPTPPQTSYYNNLTNVVGSAMPPFVPKVTASESTYSLNGVRGLVFGDEEELDEDHVIRSVTGRKEEAGGGMLVARATEVSTTSQLRGPRSLPPSTSNYSPSTSNYSPSKRPISLTINTNPTTSNVFNPIFTSSNDSSSIEPTKLSATSSKVQNAIDELEARTATSATPPASPTKRYSVNSTLPAVAGSPQYITKSLPKSPTPSITAPLSFSPKAKAVELESTARIGTLLLQRSKTGTYQNIHGENNDVVGGDSPSMSSSGGNHQDFFAPTSSIPVPPLPVATTRADQPTFASSSFTRRPSNFNGIPAHPTTATFPSSTVTTSSFSPVSASSNSRPASTVLDYASIPVPPLPPTRTTNATPLSADPKRLSAMLRRNTGKNTLRVVNPDA